MVLRLKIERNTVARAALGAAALLCVLAVVGLQWWMPCSPNIACPPPVWLSGMLAIVMTAACAGCYGTSALWMHRPKVRTWRVLLTALLMVWSLSNVAGWTTALVKAAPIDRPDVIEPTVVIPDRCDDCESGTAPKWFCLVIGCW